MRSTIRLADHEPAQEEIINDAWRSSEDVLLLEEVDVDRALLTSINVGTEEQPRFERVSFVNARFVDPEITFARASFAEGAGQFAGARFVAGPVFFGGATFEGSADFSNATFENGALFDSSDFDGSADFIEAEFGDGPCHFVHANFRGPVSFERTRLGAKGATFELATFAGMIIEFVGTRFGPGRVDFSEATVGRGLDHVRRGETLGPDEAPADVEGQEVRFVNTEFAGPADLGAGYGGGTTVFCGGTTFSHPVSLNCARLELGGAELLRGGRFGISRSISLRSTTIGEATRRPSPKPAQARSRAAEGGHTSRRQAGCASRHWRTSVPGGLQPPRGGGAGSPAVLRSTFRDSAPARGTLLPSQSLSPLAAVAEAGHRRVRLDRSASRQRSTGGR